MTLPDLHISYINLKHRRDRDLHMQHELKRVGIEAERYEALLTKGNEWNQPPYQRMFARTRGAIGCMLSQMGVMIKAASMEKHAMVLEDDLIFCSDFKERLEMIFEFLKDKDWDVMWLGGTVHYPEPYWHTTTHREMPECNCTLNRDAEPTEHHNFLRSYGSFSTHAYILNREKIMDTIKMLEDGLSTTIGIDYSFIRMAPQMNNYVFIPGCVIQRDNQSDIGSGWTMFSGFSKLGKHWWQDKI